MTRQSADLNAPCGTCGGPGTGGFTQIAENGLLRWELGEGCDRCLVQGCDRGRGAGPADLRAELLAQHGAYRLSVPEGTRGVAKVLRDVLGLSLSEAQEAARALRGPGYEGTCVELTLVAELLDVAGPVSTRDR
ncbi:hypothetical protein [Lentzea sp. NBRC 102530]|uniref:hypothetical protein n=1 Tax=Lentzea sp. NBRC 102530 TaxID=3032201 RepID=UPI0024A4DA34|nr:hypothetical protein [Lentzea sp. NBRC 102530]GLY49725.1 hypothetical protein Lesp01_33810 [Lentzea sp. NBRC 102530]